jgi:cytochrome b561
MGKQKAPLQYGFLSVVLHWLSVPLVFGLFFFGLWMSGLSYQHKWYKLAPELHQSFGVLLTVLIIIRLILRIISERPQPLDHTSSIERALAKLVHYSLYLGLVSMFCSGYVVSTAKGKALDVFNLVSLPALFGELDVIEDLANQIHLVTAYGIVILVALHALAALRHAWNGHEIFKRMSLSKK